jgi:hypothetical protein
MRQITLPNLVYNQRAERKIVMENFAHILSPDNKVSSMEGRTVAGTREIAQGRPVFAGRASNAEAQLFQVTLI